MTLFLPLINALLIFLGICLAFIVIRGKEKNTSLLRLVLVYYLVVVIEYNQERMLRFPNYLLVAVGAAILLFWTYRMKQAEELAD